MNRHSTLLCWLGSLPSICSTCIKKVVARFLFKSIHLLCMQQIANIIVSEIKHECIIIISET